MSEASLKWLREGYPGRYGLSPEEVAHVLDGIYWERPDIEFLHWRKIEEFEGIAR